MLRRLPVLERAAIQRQPEAFQIPGVSAAVLSSSGSTGTPLVLRLDRRARRRRQRQFARFFLRSGWRPWDRSLSIKVLPDSSARLGSPLLDRTVLARRHTISILEPVESQYRLLRELDPRILQGLPSVLEELARRAEAEGWRPRRLRRIFSGSEILSDRARALLERALGAPVYDSYAAAEAFIGWECERRDGLHVIESNVVLEVLDEDGHPVSPGAVGRVVITTLDNRAMPLVRYAIGDLAVAPSGRRCPCGRPGMVLPAVLGREVPLFSIGGAKASPWGVIARLGELDFVREFQLVQPRPDQVELLIRGRDNGGPLDRRALERLVVEELGPVVEVEVREVEGLDGSPTGKAAPFVVRGATAAGRDRPARR
jgi:phenylacetate-coenzyme A ligase PaaK-like adenylate-forming protein